MQRMHLGILQAVISKKYLMDLLAHQSLSICFSHSILVYGQIHWNKINLKENGLEETLQCTYNTTLSLNWWFLKKSQSTFFKSLFLFKQREGRQCSNLFQRILWWPTTNSTFFSMYLPLYCYVSLLMQFVIFLFYSLY